MDPRSVIISVLFLYGLLNAEASREIRESCSSEYTQFTINHTMCLPDNPYARVLTPTNEAKAKVVELHNSHRSSVAEPAANMQKMYYNEDLAKLAQKWAMQCVSGHDSWDQRKLANYPGNVGQNKWASSGKVDAVAYSYATGSWYAEIKDFVFGTWSPTTGHYIQEISHKSSLVGCGGAHCYDADGKFKITSIVCNYHIATPPKTVYKKGASCSDCPNHCVNGTLCDCQGIVCLNGGRLNLGTCSCDCPKGFGGKTCLEVIVLCPGVKCKSEGSLNEDDCSCSCYPGYSGTRCEKCPGPTGWKDWCHLPGNCNIVGLSRPWLFKHCPNCNPDCLKIDAAVCGEKECQNMGTLDETSCTCSCLKGFTGDTCEAAVCGGKECQNMGTLDETSCTCSCLEGYSGDTCECQRTECLNGGQFNLGTCSCDCAAGFKGKTCSEALCADVKCKNRGSMNYNDCSCNCVSGFSGATCEICSGPAPIRASWCKQPGTCNKNFPRLWLYKLCPNCNPDCQGPEEVALCGGKECKNMGTLDATSCTCSCSKGYTGDTCENCPGRSRYYFFCIKDGQCNKDHNRVWMYENCPNCNPSCPRS